MESKLQAFPPDSTAYEKFRSWLGLQPRTVQQAPDLFDQYRAKLLEDGELPAAIETQLDVIREHV